MNLAFASEELARIRVKAAKGEELNDIEEEQMLAIWRTYLSQSNLTRLLFDKGIATEEELNEAFGGLRYMARNNEWVRQRESSFTEGYRLLIYEENGIQEYAQLTK